MQGPIGSNFAGPHSVACTEIFGEDHVIMIEIGDVKERGPKGTVASWQYSCNEAYKAVPHYSRFRGKLLLRL